MLKTAECVTPRHPDKMCDIISDALLDEYLKKDPDSRVAIETVGGHGHMFVVGEVTSKGRMDNPEITEIINKIVGSGVTVTINIVEQSPEIAQGVNVGGAGDQGIMVGYACNENNEFIPQEAHLARSLCKYIYKKQGEDGKTQITLNDNGDVDTIVASFCNIKSQVLHDMIVKWWAEKFVDIDVKNCKVYTNPAGDWSQGGFEADTGLTGRKLAVDNYGPQVTLGGGAFSGKDASKVDRSGAYMARRIAVDLLKLYKAKEVIVKLAYSIGVAEPVMATALVDGKEMKVEGYDLTPRAIIEKLKLKKPVFAKTAEWGHFGNGFEWDK